MGDYIAYCDMALTTSEQVIDQRFGNQPLFILHYMQKMLLETG